MMVTNECMEGIEHEDEIIGFTGRFGAIVVGGRVAVIQSLMKIKMRATIGIIPDHRPLRLRLGCLEGVGMT